MSTPSWVQDAIFYQIFPDRFANGDTSNDPANVRPWASSPTIFGFHGGDLRGITQHFDYLQDLGINAIYLNPIFQSSSNHRYNTTDYFEIEPMLGSMQDFRLLVKTARDHGVRLILDGVFNHCGRGFFAFNDILENHEHSPYNDWFHVIKFPPDAYSPGDAEDYLAWWGFKSLPKFNTKNPAVRDYIMKVARFWIEQGADGWRLDVPNEIDDDSFWDQFRSVVKEANPDAYLVGEIWHAEPRWVGQHHFDGLMHYPLRDALLRWLYSGTYRTSEFAARMEELQTIYPRENVFSMLLLLGSHDTERLLTKLDGDLTRAKLAYLFQFSMPGSPSIYYGDEVGLQGGKDPGCRGTFPWDPKDWNQDLRAYIKQLITFRKTSAALRHGDYCPLLADDQAGTLAFARLYQDERLVVIMNGSASMRQVLVPVSSLGLPDGCIVENPLNRQAAAVQDGFLVVTLSPCEGAWFGQH